MRLLLCVSCDCIGLCIYLAEIVSCDGHVIVMRVSCDLIPLPVQSRYEVREECVALFLEAGGAHLLPEGGRGGEQRGRGNQVWHIAVHLHQLLREHKGVYISV